MTQFYYMVYYCYILLLYTVVHPDLNGCQTTLNTMNPLYSLTLKVRTLV